MFEFFDSRDNHISVDDNDNNNQDNQDESSERIADVRVETEQDWVNIPAGIRRAG